MLQSGGRRARRPGRECRAREGRVGWAVPASSCDRSECSENDALDAGWRLTEDDDVGEFRRGKRELERVGHALPVDVSLSREPEESLDHVSKPLSRRDLYPDDGVHIRLVEPLVPHPRLDVGTLTSSER